MAGTSTAGGSGLLGCDLLRPESIRAVLDETRPDTIVNAAGSASVRESWRSPADSYATNTTGLFNLLEAVRESATGVHLIQLSSAAVYGAASSREQLPFEETDAIDPTSPYGSAKAASETLAGQYARQYGHAVTVLRLFNQIGPGQDDFHAPAGFARRIAEAEAAGEKRVMLEVGNPDAVRDFTDVRDCGSAVALVARSRQSGTFNVCSDRPTALHQLIAGLGRSARVEVGVSKQPHLAHPGDSDVVYGSPVKLAGAIGWQPQFELDQSLQALLDDWRRRV